MRSRTFHVLLIFAALLVIAACSKKEEAKGGGATPVQTGDASISGTISVDPSLKDKIGNAPLLMIFASNSSDPSQPALVVQRQVGVTFPFEYKLSKDDITLVGSSFSGRLYVSARIDPNGMVGPPGPGTFDGAYPGNPVSVGSSKVDIVINKAH